MLRMVMIRSSKCERCGQDRLQIQAPKEGRGRGPLCQECMRGGVCGQRLGPAGPWGSC